MDMFLDPTFGFEAGLSGVGGVDSLSDPGIFCETVKVHTGVDEMLHTILDG